MPKQVPSAKPSVRGSRSGRPIMALLDLLGRRWTLRIVWELREAGFVELSEEGYRLTALGWELFATFTPLNRFAERWSRQAGS